ncbi:chromate transporter [Enterovirga sp.]|uniref:chromate transporter n=1 Tax=Enterovirga sp. TaxID=2026350 RepID=UPI002B91D4BA|nr:chromate transporter [Enterovirga sp.]HMO30009.1 chromate transporter [Enterovirga sp.]
MPDAASPPTHLSLFLVFCRIGLTSFGGGISGWLLREFVQQRRWLSEEEFLNGLALSQAFPGVNVSNMAIWIGYRLLGTWGALLSLLGIIVPAAFLIVGLAAVFSLLQRYPLTHVALTGAAAAAIGLSLNMAVLTIRRVPRRAGPVAVMVLAFVAVGILRWPLPWVVLGLGTASVAMAYRRLGRRS